MRTIHAATCVCLVLLLIEPVRGSPAEPTGAADHSPQVSPRERPADIPGTAGHTDNLFSLTDRDPSEPREYDSADEPVHEGQATDSSEDESGGGSSDSALAKKTQNPVSDLISIPFQNNLGFGAGANYDLRLRPRGFRDFLTGHPVRGLTKLTLKSHNANECNNVLNIQPVIPVSLNKDWNVINRVILPLIWQPAVTPTGGDVFGMGDLQYTAFLSPAKPGKFIWGVGPVFLFPTATDKTLGTGKWSMGPSVVGLAMLDRWVVGALGQQLFSYAGESDRPYVSQMLIQPFINYNLDKGWYLTSAPIITANWNTTSDNVWTVPAGGGVGKILRIGKLPINVQVSGYYNIDKPDFAPDWTLRVQLQFLFPK